MQTARSRSLALFLIFSLWTQSIPQAAAYSVLTHEEIIDIAWKTDLEPLLKKKFPGLTPEQIKDAHAFAYGGSIIQDLGYYPHGSREFSDLVHYVRSGDFVIALLRDAKDANEYGFALGALAHYASDVTGHPAVNRAVAIEFPKLKKKFGDSVTYGQDRSAHIQTEFGFDMDQVAKNRYTTDNYHDFIGFKVATDLLARAFQETYGIQLDDVLPNRDKAIESYRHAVSKLIPEATRVALKVRKDEIAKEYPTNARQKFLFNISRADYEKRWGTNYFHDSFKTKFFAFLVRILPKIGPLRALAFKVPTPQTEDLYFKSINKTMERFRTELARSAADKYRLSEVDMDTGAVTRRGEYDLADEAYGSLLKRLGRQDLAATAPELRADLLRFYSAPQRPAVTQANKKDAHKDEAEIESLIAKLRQQPARVSQSE